MVKGFEFDTKDKNIFEFLGVAFTIYSLGMIVLFGIPVGLIFIGCALLGLIFKGVVFNLMYAVQATFISYSLFAVYALFKNRRNKTKQKFELM
ncbi:MAG: hypothetical protein EKK61_00090 [Rickettsiales bacterium]|nr:MAG: hypothetical protein EKK61_00090 [Rickettsiales bacterium]